MIGPVVKTATREPERAQLRREAHVLLRARHPGVVHVVAFSDEDGRTRLEIGPIEGSPLADAPPWDALDALRFTAALARTIADLHNMGIAHRSLRADHVLSTDDGRPVLSEFGEATTRADEADRHADAEALRDLVELLARATTPESRSSRAGAALRSLATDLRGLPEPPSPAEVAARAGRAASRHARKRRRRTAAPRRHRVAAFAVVPVIAVGAVVLMSRHAGDPRETGPGIEAHSGAATDRSTSTATSTSMGPITTALRIDVGGATFDVGQEGDRVVVADWHCDGEPSAALLRPATGEVFVFASLPAEGETLTGHHVATVVGAESIVDDHVDAPCPPLVVRSTDGIDHPIGER